MLLTEACKSVARGRARWERVNVSVHILEEGYALPPLSRPVACAPRVMQRAVIDVIPAPQWVPHESPALPVTPEWLLAHGYRLRFGM